MADHSEGTDLEHLGGLSLGAEDSKIGHGATGIASSSAEHRPDGQQHRGSAPGSELSGDEEDQGSELETTSLYSSFGARSPAVASLFGDSATAAAGAGLEATSAASDPEPQPPAWDEQAAEAASAAAAAAAAAASSSGLVGGEAAAGLRRYPKHVFVFSSAGKPVYSLHGDEEELAGLMAAAQAIISVVQSGGQQLKHLRQGTAKELGTDGLAGYEKFVSLVPMLHSALILHTPHRTISVGRALCGCWCDRLRRHLQ